MSVKGPGFDPWYCLFQNLCLKLVICHHLTTPSYNPLLEWNVWYRHLILDKWQTLEAARHRIAQWKSIHHVCERSWVWSPVLSLSKFMFATCQLPPSNQPPLIISVNISGMESHQSFDDVYCRTWNTLIFIHYGRMTSLPSVAPW